MLETLLYGGTALGMLVVGILLTSLITPQKEFKLIKEKNIAAMLAFGGKILGMALVMGAALENAISLMDLLIFSALAIAVQIVSYFIFDLLTFTIKFKEEIENNNTAVGGLIAFVAVSIGFIVGKALTYRPELEGVASAILNSFV